MQFLSDMLNRPVDRPNVVETTALGAAFLAALQSGLTTQDDFAKRLVAETAASPPRWTRPPETAATARGSVP